VLYTFLNVENDNPLQTLKNREDTPVDLLSGTSLNGTTLNDYTYLNYDLTLHGRLLKLISKWENEGDKINKFCNRFESGASSASMVQTPDILSVFTEITETNSYTDQSGEYAVGFGTNVPPGLIPKIDLNGAGYNFPMTVVIDYDFDGDFSDVAYDVPGTDPCGEGTATATSRDTGIVGSGIYLRMWIGEDPSNPRIYYDLCEIPFYLESGTTHTDIFSCSGSINETLFANEKIWFAWVWNYDIPGGLTRDIVWTWDYNRALFEITADTIVEDSTAKAIAIHEGWSRLCEIITDQKLAFRSEYFGRVNSQGISYSGNGCAAFTAITNGLNIRGLEERIETTLADMFDSCNSVWGCGLGLVKVGNDWLVEVEELDYFYSNNEILRFDNVANIQMRHVQDRIYNEISVRS
jgi:hypothetical protein